MATMRASTGTGSAEPTGSTTRSCSTRRSLTCREAGRSSTPSRTRVPPEAPRKRPRRARSAPVNAPTSCPKSSASSRVGDRAAGCTTAKGPAERGLSSCSHRAARVFPEPGSPTISTVASLAAARSSRSANARIASHSPWKADLGAAWVTRTRGRSDGGGRARRTGLLGSSQVDAPPCDGHTDASQFLVPVLRRAAARRKSACRKWGSPRFLAYRASNPRTPDLRRPP